MNNSIVLAVVVLLPAVFADDVPNEKVKAAFVEGLKRMNVSPRLIEGYEKRWDGSLPETLGELKLILLNVGFNAQEAQALVDGMATVAKNKDNPSWKTYYGNLFIQVGGADRSTVEKLEQTAPDTIPTDTTVAMEALKKSGLPAEYAQGLAKLAVWLGKVHA